MSTTGTTTFLIDGPHQYFTLLNEQYLRRFSFAPNWGAIAIGILCSIEATASISNPRGCGLWIGLGSSAANGTASGWKNKASVNRMLGGGFGRIGQAAYGNTGPLVFSSNASGSQVYFDLSMGGKIISGSFSVAGGNGANAYFATAPTGSEPPRKSLCLLYMSQSTSTISSKLNTLTNYTTYAEEMQSHTNATMFDALMTQFLTVPYINGSIENSTSAQTLAQDLAFPLDTLNIFWTGSVPLRIYEIAIARTQ